MRARSSSAPRPRRPTAARSTTTTSTRSCGSTTRAPRTAASRPACAPRCRRSWRARTSSSALEEVPRRRDAGRRLRDRRPRPRLAALVLPVGRAAGRGAPRRSRQAGRAVEAGRRCSSARSRRMLADPRAEALAPASPRSGCGSGPGEDPSRRAALPVLRPAARGRDAPRRPSCSSTTSCARTGSLLELSPPTTRSSTSGSREHYGIPGVTGDDFRRVDADPTEHRRGHPRARQHPDADLARRTGPRRCCAGSGSWRCCSAARRRRRRRTCRRSTRRRAPQGGRELTTRERMEQHRANPRATPATASSTPSGWRSTTST